MALTIIGAGEVGRVFERCAQSAGEEVTVLRRGDEPSSTTLAAKAVIVAVRESDLEPLIPKLAPFAIRCVFPQNGLIEPLLAGLGPVTRGLLWFTAKGDFFHVLQPSIFRGPEAAKTVRLLEAGGIAARVERDEGAFLREVAIKLAWNCVVGLPLAVHRVTLGGYLQHHASEARAIVEETCRAMSRAYGLVVHSSEAYARLVETTRDLAWMTGGTKALELRNGAVVRLGKQYGVPTPINEALLLQVAPGV